MFELETEIAQWRRKMAKSVGREKLRGWRRLEGHLHAITSGELVRTGVPGSEEAFRTATAPAGRSGGGLGGISQDGTGANGGSRELVVQHFGVLVAVALAFVFGSRAAIKMNRPLTSDDIKHHFDAARFAWPIST